MIDILLSIIIVFGGSQGPSGDFNDSTAVDQPVATSTTTSTDPVKQKKGSFDGN